MALDPDPDAQAYGLRGRIAAVVLLLVVGSSAVLRAIENGASGLAEGIALLYIAVVLVYGVFSGRLNTPQLQAAFGVGLAAYGSLLYLEYGSLLWLGVMFLGAVVTVENVREAVSSR